MIVIGENINSSIKDVEEAITQRNEPFIRDLALRQKSAGADYLEVNSGLQLYPAEEAEDVAWLVPLVQDATGLPICIDSAHASVHKAALEYHRGRAILNSINGDPRSWDAVVPLAKDHGCLIIALLSDRRGIPSDVSGRIRIAEEIAKGLSTSGFSLEDLFIDPVVMPISVDTRNAIVFLDTVEELKRLDPQVKTVSALSNMSHGLPKRRLINQAFLILSLWAGLDAAIMNPLDPKMTAFAQVAETLLDRDPFCSEYLAAYRAGKLD